MTASRALLAVSRALRTSPVPRRTHAAIAARWASSAPVQGNPDIINTLPNTADEVKVDVPSESVPSSSALDSPLSADSGTDWSRSYHGLSSVPFPKEVADILLQPIDPLDVEIKPDGLIYLPEIKYRRVLNRAFGPGGWGLAPRSETNVGPKIVSREYALVCMGRLVGIARGEQEYFDPNGIPTATEAVKSNALMRCCKDLGVASELWDPRFIREFKAKYAVEVYAEHVPTKKKRKLWRRKDQPKFDYPYKE
ncbi:unnamed protein product [Peniophora sp. CBMAI 1063]|nr:unnamed protein product [Peniophora sp. CBMAI 1063]